MKDCCHSEGLKPQYLKVNLRAAQAKLLLFGLKDTKPGVTLFKEQMAGRAGAMGVGWEERREGECVLECKK